MKYLLLLLALSPLYARKAPKPFLFPTQPNIVRGCVTVGGITFIPVHGYFNTTGVSGNISNNCGRDVMVSITAEFFDRYGNNITSAYVRKLATPVYTQFEARPEGDVVVKAVTGRITTVIVIDP